MHLDEAQDRGPVLVGHPVGRLDLAAADDVRLEVAIALVVVERLVVERQGGTARGGGRARDRARAGRSSVVLREGAQGELDVVVGDPVGLSRPSGRYQVAIPLRAVRMKVAAIAGIGRRGTRRRPMPSSIVVAEAGLVGVAPRRRSRPGAVSDRWRHSVTNTLERSGSAVTTSTCASTSAASRSLGIRAWGLADRPVERRLEIAGRALDDRPQEVLLGRDMGVQAGALDVEGAGDVADAGRGVAVRVEQLARRVVDLAPPAPVSITVLLPNDR